MTNTMTVTTMTTAMKIMEGYMMTKMMKLTKTRTMLTVVSHET